jgi:hypothetical protein
MVKPLPLLGQGLAYAAFAAIVGVLSIEPSWSPLHEDEAVIRLSLAHTGQRKADCRVLRPEEIAALPPNMRRPQDCPRERLPVTVQLDIDGHTLYAQTLRPSGFWKDGASHVYQRFPVRAGHHRLTARLRDSAHQEGFEYERHFDIDIAAGQNVVIDFLPQQGGFILR